MKSFCELLGSNKQPHVSRNKCARTVRLGFCTFLLASYHLLQRNSKRTVRHIWNGKSDPLMATYAVENAVRNSSILLYCTGRCEVPFQHSLQTASSIRLPLECIPQMSLPDTCSRKDSDKYLQLLPTSIVHLTLTYWRHLIKSVGRGYIFHSKDLAFWLLMEEPSRCCRFDRTQLYCKIMPKWTSKLKLICSHLKAS